jgi:AraC-like DNA-binding protein
MRAPFEPTPPLRVGRTGCRSLPPSEDLTLARIARRAAMSVRTLSRRVREQTGTTPLQ